MVPTRRKFQPTQHVRDVLVQSACVAALTIFGLFALNQLAPQVTNSSPEALNHVSLRQPSAALITSMPRSKRLIFYNRPPKTGSTSVRIAMKKALSKANLVAAKCFNMIEWNEMALRTIINRRQVDFYGCHTRLIPERFRDVAMMRGGNVTFMTSTRESADIILSSYLQDQRDRDVAAIRDENEMNAEVERFKQFVEKYPVDALYAFHGANDITRLQACPVGWPHIMAMRRIAERYEIVVDVKRADESAVMVEAVTGLKPDFNVFFNERTKKSTPMLQTLLSVNTSHKTCGNELVHEVLTMQFNVIKDRLMQNRCFEEANGSGELCDRAALTMDSIRERGRFESLKQREQLRTGKKP